MGRGAARHLRQRDAPLALLPKALSVALAREPLTRRRVGSLVEPLIRQVGGTIRTQVALVHTAQVVHAPGVEGVVAPEHTVRPRLLASARSRYASLRSVSEHARRPFGRAIGTIETEPSCTSCIHAQRTAGTVGQRGAACDLASTRSYCATRDVQNERRVVSGDDDKIGTVSCASCITGLPRP